MKKIIIPCLLSLIALGILLGLGTWQMKRHTWKEDLLSKIREGMANSTQEYSGWLEKAKDQRLNQFARVKLKGSYIPEKTVYVHSIRKGVLGNLVFTPLRLQDDKVIFVNRGFIPYHLTNKEAQVSNTETVEVAGIIRLPENRGSFTPQPDLKKKVWYVANLKNMAEAVALNGTEVRHYLEATSRTTAAKWPEQRKPAALMKSIPNKHYEYALTWFGLAGALLMVFVAYIWSATRKT